MIRLAVLGFAACSSLMLITNKVAIHLMPAPCFVLMAQCLSAALAVKGLGLFGAIEVDEIEWHKVRSFTLVALSGLGSLYTNIKVLQFCNVETFITFRCSTSLVVSVAEWFFLGRELPGCRSIVAILGMVLGAGAYTATDKVFVLHGYLWVAAWYFTFCFNQLFVKHIVDTTVFKSNWGRVYYTNMLCALMLLPVVPLTDANTLQSIVALEITPRAWGVLAASCVLGTGISYFAFMCRSLVSATAFNIIGDVCKLATVIINLFIWDRHASPLGFVFLCSCIAAASLYQQAPMRKADSIEPPRCEGSQQG